MARPKTGSGRPRPTQKQVGLGWDHRHAVERLIRAHRDGTPCNWCGRPMWKDRTRNYDYNPASTNPSNGSLHGDHSGMSRSEALRRGLPIPLPDRLLHGRCNIQRGEGTNDHLAAAGTPATPTPTNAIDTSTLAIAWPW